MKKMIFSILSIIIVFAFFGCKKIPTQYSDYEELHIENWDEVETVMTDGLFLVYYYSPFCPDCKSIQEEMAKLIYYRDNQYTIYLMISMDIDHQGTPPIELRGVPALFIYNDREFIEMKLGPAQVLDFMNSH
ncbi:MAG: thioredoxin domain-containing protein [Bacilli bacterium]|nr:thioredoxin domain-containing protein [Bacilli bacterium]MDD3067545.1 thioredoxin domain-containing protein [Acholeplasmataceae bacterium]MDD4194358.1 thioredoxin domain-containing protein [Acholeplasmataceae bacterium]